MSRQLSGTQRAGRLNRRRCPGGLALGWGLVFFLSCQLALSIRMETVQPELRDPEFGHKLAKFKKLARKQPHRQVVLMLGSSRTALGFKPESLRANSAHSESAPLFFNFGLSGAGPLQQLLYLRRLLADGCQPSWLFIELMPAMLLQEADPATTGNLAASRLSFRDLQVLTPYCRRPRTLMADWLAARIAPCFANRFTFLQRYGPHWLPPTIPLENWWAVYSPHGWMPGWEKPKVQQKRKALEWARKEYEHGLKGFRIGTTSHRALRELLTLCRQRDIHVALYLMPEGSIFRAWYPPQALTLIDGYLAQLQKEYQLPVVDSRGWMKEEDFFDSHHLLRHSASAFTRRFEQEAIKPLLEGKILRHLLAKQ